MSQDPTIWMPSSHWSLDSVVEAYTTWLEVHSPVHHQPFKTRLRDSPEAAHAEAVTFNVLSLKRTKPRPAEDPSTGGVDFTCTSTQGRFAVEVTALTSEAVERKSGLPASAPFPATGSFSQITTQLMREAVGKARQLSRYAMPRLLVLASSHPKANMVLDEHSAVELLVGTRGFSVPVGDGEAAAKLVTGLVNSVFMKPGEGGQIVAARRSISAVLLMHITEQGANLIGLLHPDPEHRFDNRVFDSVHFCRLTQWPITGPFGYDWVGPQPKPTHVPHVPARVVDWDLR